MQLLGTRVVRIEPGDDAGAAWAAGTSGQKGLVKSHPLGRQPIQVGRLNMGVAVRAHVIPGHVVCNDQNEVGWSRLLSCRLTGQAAEY